MSNGSKLNTKPSKLTAGMSGHQYSVRLTAKEKLHRYFKQFLHTSTYVTANKIW